MHDDGIQYNDLFNLTEDIIRNTSRSVFLTGKAGSGKTTFLHYIKNKVNKNCIVAAPTGIAAINAGGVTLHSLLQLPFEPFIPNFEGKKKLDFHLKLRRSKIEMLRELDLLIIDEVSMLRADMLDAIDFVLKRYRNNQDPFGGVQMLFIGDMFQLPPVVQSNEWDMLQSYYPTPFFFHAQVLDQYPLLYIEFDKIYRQKDINFINILNNIRNNCPTSHDLQILNARYNPSFSIEQAGEYIVLSTHNYKTERINTQKLHELSSQEVSYTANISGEFNVNSFPTEFDLKLKVGAQIMFIKNDSGEKRRFYNGKLAVISSLNKDKITVRFTNGDTLDLESETWHNLKYKLNDETGEIEEELLGSFSQYPIRLAWAITIHKSQGLTFDKVIVDAGQAFTSGQVYVALSRCTTLDGIVLYSPVSQSSIQVDKAALAFSKKVVDKLSLEKILENEKPAYCRIQLKKYFNLIPVIKNINILKDLISEKQIPDKLDVMDMVQRLHAKATTLQEIGISFCREIDNILDANHDLGYLETRVSKGAQYFHNEMTTSILAPLLLHIEALQRTAKVKAYLKKVIQIYDGLQKFIISYQSVYYGNINLTDGTQFLALQENEKTQSVKVKAKPQRGDSAKITLSLFTSGNSLQEIAVQRNLAVTTIESHLVELIASGDISVFDVMSVDKAEFGLQFMKDNPLIFTVTSLKDNLPSNYGYFEIRALLNYHNRHRSS